MSTPDPKPRPKRRSWLILVPVLLLPIIGGAMAIPNSPIYLPKLLEPDMSIEGRTRSEWVKDLSSEDPKQRSTAAASLGKMNTGGRKALPDLVRLMKSDPDAEVRAVACDAAGKMFPSQDSEAAKAEYSAAVLEAFTAGLTDTDPRVRHNAAIGILKLKDKAKSAVPVLLAAVKDVENDTNLNMFHSTVRQVMLRALGEAAAGTPDAVPIFAAILAIKLDPPKRGGRPMGDISKEEKEASHKFVEGSIDRRIAVAGLGLAGEHGKPYAPQIRELLDSKFEDDKIEARQALRRMGLSENGN